MALVGERIMAKVGKVSDPRGWFKKIFGVIFILVAIAIISGYDKKLQISLLDAGFLDVTKIEQRLLEKNDKKDVSINDTSSTDKNIGVLVRFGKYVFGDRNRRGILIVGSKGRVYLDLNSCTLSINDNPVLTIEKNYYPVIRAAISHTLGEPLFTFNSVDVLARAQNIVFDIQRLAYENKEDFFYESGADPADVFKGDSSYAAERLNEEDIRPDDSHDRWLTLLGEEVKTFFPMQKRKKVMCPGCDSTQVESEFIKLGFIYKWCKNCFSLYASPRPTEKEIETFYKSSKAMKFYGDSIFDSARESRHEHQITPLVEWLKNIISKHAPTTVKVLDFMPKFFFLSRLS